MGIGGASFGHGELARHFPVTTSSEDARKFFLQGISQIHSFWFVESERSCLQALEYDPMLVQRLRRLRESRRRKRFARRLGLEG